MIRPSHFYDMLDCLAKQMFAKKRAMCTGKDFGGSISSAAREYFSVAVVNEPLDGNKVVLGLLSNDAASVASRRGYTFTIFIDSRKIEGAAFQVLASIILAHEVCHFAYYYELFVYLGDTTDSKVQIDFTHKVSKKLVNAVIKERDGTSQTNIDEHNISELVKTFGGYDKKHFTKGARTLVDYQELFHSFLEKLNFDGLLREFNLGKSSK